MVGEKLNSELSVKVTWDDNELLVEVFDISNKEVDVGSKVELNVDPSLDTAAKENIDANVGEAEWSNLEVNSEVLE